MNPYYASDDVTLWHGSDIEVLRELSDASVNCVVTSPPYFGLRDYGVDGQRGLESSPAEYVAGMVDVFREVRRALADDGTLWLNIGDSYSSAAGGAPKSGNIATNGGERFTRPRAQDFVPPKNLIGVPWRVAFALQDDGWTLRNAIVRNKPNPMPTSVIDRLNNSYEHLFLFVKSRRYWFDLDAIKVPSTGDRPGNRPEAIAAYAAATGTERGARRWGGNATSTLLDVHETRNPGDVWTIPTAPFAEAHFACMPPALAERCVLAGCKPGGVVLDPYSGSGTTGMVATKHGRKYIGIDLNRDYLDLSLRTRLVQPGLDLEGGIA